MIEAKVDEIHGIEQLHEWLVEHLREDHHIESVVTPMDDRTFTPYAFADLKAAHDQMHLFEAEAVREAARVLDSPEAAT